MPSDEDQKPVARPKEKPAKSPKAEKKKEKNQKKKKNKKNKKNGSAAINGDLSKIDEEQDTTNLDETQNSEHNPGDNTTIVESNGGDQAKPQGITEVSVAFVFTFFHFYYVIICVYYYHSRRKFDDVRTDL